MPSQSAALDFHVISSLQDLTLQDAAPTPGPPLQIGTQHKLVSHMSTCSTAGRLEWTSSPWLQKSWAALWLEGFIHMVCSLVKSVALRNNQQDPFSTTSQFFHLLAISLWQINASLWLNRQPRLPLQWTVSSDCYSSVCLCLCFLSVVSLPIFTIKFYHPHHHHHYSSY